MRFLLLAEVDWVYLILAAFLLLNVLTWPSYRRMARDTNLGLAEGDLARSRDGALRMLHSWLPLVLLERLLDAGRHELIISQRSRMLGEYEEAIRWGKAGLRRARKPLIRFWLHRNLARAYANCGELDTCLHHLEEMRRLAQQHPRPATIHDPDDSDTTWPAIVCYQTAGRVGDACRLAREALAHLQGPPSGNLTTSILEALLNAGDFDEVLRHTAWMIDAQPTGLAQPQSSLSSGASLGVQQLRQSAADADELSRLLIAATAARRAGRWDLCARYLQAAAPYPAKWHALDLQRAGLQAAYAAHLARPELVAESVKSLEALAARFPRDHLQHKLAQILAADAWQTLGEHQRALDTAPTGELSDLDPLQRSELAALFARSLEALGRHEEADQRRAEARRLAPEAYWSQPSLESPARQTLPRLAPPSPAEDAQITSAIPVSGPAPAPVFVALRPAAPDAPIARVASGTACAAWILAAFALLPLVGWMAGVALLVMAVILLSHPRPLPHDRRVGWAGLAIALLSLGFTSLSFVNWLSSPLPTHAGTKADRPSVSRPSDEASTEQCTPVSDRNAAAEHPAHRSAEDSSMHRPYAMTLGANWRKWVIALAVLVVSIMLHEIGHAVAAWWSGDPTSRDMGRVSLNPARHLEPFGSLIVPCILLALSSAVLAWARPVMIRPDRFRSPRRGQLAVSLAGVSLNLMLALLATRLLTLICTLLARLHPELHPVELFDPLVALPSAQIPSAPGWGLGLDVLRNFVLLNALLLWFNLLPIPPLDGFGVLRALAPRALGATAGRLGGLVTTGLLLLVAFKLLDFLMLPALAFAMILLGLAQLAAYGFHGL